MSDYVIHLPESMCVDMFDEYTNHTKELLTTHDVLYELANSHYVENVLEKNSYTE